MCPLTGQRRCMAGGALSKGGKVTGPETLREGLTSGFPPGGGMCRKQQSAKRKPGVPGVAHWVRNPRRLQGRRVPSPALLRGFRRQPHRQPRWRLPMRLGSGSAVPVGSTRSGSSDSPLLWPGSNSQDRLESPRNVATLEKGAKTCFPSAGVENAALGAIASWAVQKGFACCGRVGCHGWCASRLLLGERPHPC